MEKNKMKKNKSQRKKLFFTRCAVFATLLLMLLPMLCSMAFPVTITISNPDSIPYEYDYFELNNTEATWGANQLSSSLGAIVTISDGVLFLNDFRIELEGNISDGQYVVDISLTAPVDETTSSWVGLPLDSISSFGEYSIVAFLITLGDINTVTVQNFEFDGISVVSSLWLRPYEEPTPTESITNVWTGITEWFMGALNSVQGLFFTTGEFPFTDYASTTDVIVYDGKSFGLINPTVVSGFDWFVNGSPPDEALFSIDAVDIDGVTWIGTSYDDVLLALSDGEDIVYWNLAANNWTFPGQSQLTFLGTLAVIGVAIGVAFLLIATVRRFLSLRS